MSATGSKTKYFRELRKMVRELGIELVNISVTRGDHVKLEVRRNGEERMVFAAMSPSDWRANLNLRRNIVRVFDRPVRKAVQS